MTFPPIVPVLPSQAPYAGTTLNPGPGPFAYLYCIWLGLVLGLVLGAAVAGTTELLDATRPWRWLARPMEKHLS